MLKLKLLGTPTIHLADRPVAFKTNKSEALLIYLAINQRALGRDMLADLLWTDMSHQQARKNLRDTLVYVRAAIGEYILVETHTLAFNYQLPSAIDVNDFMAQIPHGRATGDLALIESALHLYQADFLAGFQLANAPVFDQWAMQKGEELHTFAMTNLEWLAIQYLQAAAYDAGLRITQRLLILEPWQESYHLLQMRLLVLAGNRVAALRQFELCRQLLADELQLVPSATALALYEQIKDEIFPLLPAPLANELGDSKQQVTDKFADKFADKFEDMTEPGPAHYPSNLPRQLTELIGRAAEVSELIAIIDTGQPIITLVGEGGIGKSHLALAVAQVLLTDPQSTARQRLRDGIWFVALADIVTTGIPKAVLRERVAARIGEALQLSFGGANKLSTQLERILQSRNLLLVLDNFEHLMPVADFVFELLQRAPGLQILVTSRTTLGLRAEQIVEVGGLAVPTIVSHQEPWTAWLRDDAIALFYACAQRIRRDFRLRQDNIDAIVRICDFVAGSPLAIKLAAALLDLHSCTQLAALLVQDYTMLSNEQLDLPLRQRSMQSVLDISWQYLERDQAHLLASCSLLQGMFPTAAAVVVAQIPTAQLPSFVRQSWLHYDKKLQRFTMHELLRQYAARQLTQWPIQHAAAAARHAAYHMALLQENENLIRQDPAVVGELSLVWSDVQTAWEWSVQQQRLDLLDQGAQGLSNYYQLSSSFYEAVQTLEPTIAAIRQNMTTTQTTAQMTAKQRTLARLLGCSLIFYFYLGQQKELQAVASEALALGRELDDNVCQAIALNGLAHAAQLRGNYREMLQLATAGSALLDALLDQNAQLQLRIRMRNTQASAFWSSGNFEQGINYFHKVFDDLRRAPDLEQEARINLGIGFLYQRQKNFTLARDYLSEALRLAHRCRSQRTIALAHLHLGELWCDWGAYDRCAGNYAQAAEILQIIGDLHWQGWLHASYGRFWHLQDDQVRARAAYDLAIQLAQSANLGQVKYRTAYLLGHLLAEQGALTAAITSYQTAITLHQQLNIFHGSLDAYAGLAVTCLAQNDMPTAQEMVEATLTLITARGIVIADEPAQVYRHCIDVLQAMSDPRAATLLTDAQRYIEQQASRIDDDEVRQTFLAESGKQLKG